MKQISNCLKVLVLIFLFNQCEKDTEYIETAPETGRHSNFKVNTVSAKQRSKITGYLASKNINLLQKDTIAGAVFDTDNIIEVIDELNTTNYSFRFVYPDTPEHVFYNLVVGTDGQGNYNTPYVLRYECDADYLQTFIDSNYNFHYFKGSISHHRFTDFFQNDDLFSKTTTDCTQFDQYGDPLACEETSIDGSGPSGSGGSTEVGGSTNGETVPGTSLPGGTGGFSITVYHIIPSGDWYVFGPGSVCQHPGECEIVIAMNGQDEQQRTATECPPCTLPTGGVGVSTTYPLAVNQLHLTLGGNLSDAQLDWLVDHADITQQLNDFIAEQSFSDEAKDFALDALELMRLNPDIILDVSRSFNAPFLIDLSEVLPDDDPATNEPDKETLMHVYNKLIETESFKDLFTDVFGPDSPYTVKFKIGNNTLDCSSSTANACTKYIVTKINGVPTRIKDKLITITFDSDKLQLNSFISVARTIIHEAIHANLVLLKIEDEDATLPYNSEFTVEVFADLLLERFGADDHSFMANYYRPVLRQNLQEVLPLLYSQTRIDEISNVPVNYIYPDGTVEFLENWNWNNFWEYFPWAGLHNTTEFMGQIGTNALYNKLFEAYYDKGQKLGRDLPE